MFWTSHRFGSISKELPSDSVFGNVRVGAVPGVQDHHLAFDHLHLTPGDLHRLRVTWNNNAKKQKQKHFYIKYVCLNLLFPQLTTSKMSLREHHLQDVLFYSKPILSKTTVDWKYKTGKNKTIIMHMWLCMSMWSHFQASGKVYSFSQMYSKFNSKREKKGVFKSDKCHKLQGWYNATTPVAPACFVSLNIADHPLV